MVAGVSISAASGFAVVGVLATALALICLHVSWGAGFLHGLILFADRWRRPEQGPPRLEHRGADAALSTAE